MVSNLREARFRVIAKLEGDAFEQGLADLTEVVLRVVYGAIEAQAFGSRSVCGSESEELSLDEVERPHAALLSGRR